MVVLSSWHQQATGNRVSRAELGAWLRPEANLNLVFLPIGLGTIALG